MTDIATLLSRYKRHAIAGASGLLAGVITEFLVRPLFTSGIMMSLAYLVFDRLESLLNSRGLFSERIISSAASGAASVAAIIILFGAAVSAPLVACFLTASTVFEAGSAWKRARVALLVVAGWLYMLLQAVFGSLVIYLCGCLFWLIIWLISWLISQPVNHEIKMVFAVAFGVVIGSICVDLIRR